MSRRSRYGRPHSAVPRGPRGDAPRVDAPRPDALSTRDPKPRESRESRESRGPRGPAAPAGPIGHQPLVAPPPVPAAAVIAAGSPFEPDPQAADVPERASSLPSHGTNGNGHVPVSTSAAPTTSAPGCTAPQLRRFIKSRTYVPMHELRRRFGINGSEDDVSLVEAGGHRIFVGLPPREGRLLEELLRGGDVGYQLSLDPLTPIVIGLYPMRPVPRS